MWFTVVFPSDLIADGGFIFFGSREGVWAIEIYFLFLLSLRVTISQVGRFFGKNSRRFIDKKTSFECGFDKVGSTRAPFAIQYYHFGLLFLLFDVELILLAPILLGVGFRVGERRSYEGFCWGIFLFLLVLGLAHEYREGNLEWKT